MLDAGLKKLDIQLPSPFMKTTIVKLNRFTTLPVLLDLLKKKKLTLLDPKLWEDKNDSELISEYKKRKNIQNLFLICFSAADETVHHWKTFSNGSSGCVIEFDAKALFKMLDRTPGLKRRRVKYVKLSAVEGKNKKIKVDDIPFTKRWPYRCEEEYRVLVETDKKSSFFEIDIDVNCIRRITISQQMPESIFQTIKSYLRELKQNPDGKVNRSTLYENKRWIQAFRES